MYAAALGHHDVVALLVQAGADARLQDRDQQSALVHAANSGSVQSVQLLLEQASADANDKTVHGLPLLVHAISSGQESLAELLVQHGASVDAVDGGSAPVLLASQAGSLRLLQALIQKGASLTAASEQGVTPLMVLAAS
jgi:ankyrin repeat protein